MNNKILIAKKKRDGRQKEKQNSYNCSYGDFSSGMLCLYVVVYESDITGATIAYTDNTGKAPYIAYVVFIMAGGQ